jgi:methyl-accepting chemotaxis protein
MDQVTQQNAAMVEETTAASHGLAREAEGLAELIGRFQLGGRADPTARAAA